MSDQVTLSIIVPVYNIEAFLPESLDSLSRIQFDEPYEIIVIDDGSSDGSLAILRAYEERHRALRIITGPNGGVSRARNAGLDAAKGKYITFVDGTTRSNRVSSKPPSGKWRRRVTTWFRETPGSSGTTSFFAFSPAANGFRRAGSKPKIRIN